jgi:hypothetical protein
MRNRHSTVVSFPAGRVCHLILFVGNKTAQVSKQTSSVHGGDDAMCVCARARKQQQSGGLVPLRKLGSSSSLSCTVAALSIIHGIQRHPPIRYSGPTPTGTPCSDSSSCPLSPVAGVIFSILPCPIGRAPTASESTGQVWQKSFGTQHYAASSCLHASLHLLPRNKTRNQKAIGSL